MTEKKVEVKEDELKKFVEQCRQRYQKESGFWAKFKRLVFGSARYVVVNSNEFGWPANTAYAWTTYRPQVVIPTDPYVPSTGMSRRAFFYDPGNNCLWFTSKQSGTWKIVTPGIELGVKEMW